MLEIGIFSVILLAAGYWATMFVMGRRGDVIHGKFVHTDDEGAFTQPAMPARPPFPKTSGQSCAARTECPTRRNDPVARPVSSEGATIAAGCDPAGSQERRPTSEAHAESVFERSGYRFASRKTRQNKNDAPFRSHRNGKGSSARRPSGRTALRYRYRPGPRRGRGGLRSCRGRSGTRRGRSP